MKADKGMRAMLKRMKDDAKPKAKRAAFNKIAKASKKRGK